MNEVAEWWAEAQVVDWRDAVGQALDRVYQAIEAGGQPEGRDEFLLRVFEGPCPN